jgi:hypothetical protein
MAALASIATLVGAGASLYGNIRQAQTAQAANRAQVQVAQQQEQARQQVLQQQQQEAALARSQALTRTIASTRARMAAGGRRPDEGSAGAVMAGLRQDAAAVQGADEGSFRARLAQGRSSLLNEDGTLNALLQSGRSFGYVARSLLD